MNNIITITIYGLLIGVIGTGLGGVLGLLMVNPNKRFLSMLIGITAGIMLSVVTFELLPEAYSIGGLFPQVLGMSLGVIIIYLLENIVSTKSRESVNKGNKKFLRTGIIIGIGIALHNLPEGLAIGSGFIYTYEIGLKVALITVLHNIPEGVAMATPLRISGYSRMKVLLLTVLSGLPTGIGALLGSFLGSVSSYFISLCLSLAGGAMIYITCGSLIPNSIEMWRGRTSTIGIVIGFIIGMIMIIKL